MPSSRDSYSGDDKKKKRSSHSNPNKNSKSSPHRASKIAHHIDNDDDSVADFSVAPGMDSDVKSVVSVNFDHVYQRGRKVRRKLLGHKLLSSKEHDYFHVLITVTHFFYIQFMALARTGSLCCGLYWNAQTDQQRIRRQAN